jgi:hypothetical protein
LPPSGGPGSRQSGYGTLLRLVLQAVHRRCGIRGVHCLFPAQTVVRHPVWCHDTQKKREMKRSDWHPASVIALSAENSREGRFLLFVLALGDHRSGGLAFANKATTQAQSRHDQRQCQCNLLHGTPHRVIRPSYTDMGPPLAIVPKSHSEYEYSGDRAFARRAGKMVWETCRNWQPASFRTAPFLLKAVSFSDRLELQEAPILGVSEID